MKLIFAFIITLFTIHIGYAQDTYRVSIRIIDEETQKEVPNLGINIIENGKGIGAGTTDGNGIASIIIPRTTRNITLILTSSDIEIKYPRGGETHAPSPEIENPTIEFLVKTSAFRMLSLEIAQLSQEKKQLETLADSLNKRMLAEQISFKDSLETINLKINSLFSEITNKKQGIYAEITNNYLQFLNAILDMEETLKYVSNTFTQEGELRNLNRQIEILNHARNKMHENHLSYVQVVEQYWDKNTSLRLSMLYKQALENTYGEVILPLNEELISKLKDSWNGNKPRIIVQRKAVKSTNLALLKLHEEIEDLRYQADEVLPLLETSIVSI
ncbi:hypothetical protein SYJ56_02000 [Algoriphagus sp. D3-2-R+10]|uniref:hypothetical protein n=1 Tax=Algoriphagus aurantiacus TaxID=3103948 RepID=UPI002B3E2F22|nr:hypothetical protein [Algoriphagus sp. D3-2-R+10]MEB2774058.1 hypothetical protein [Algoriphagus sp. D3-2-R+10]